MRAGSAVAQTIPSHAYSAICADCKWRITDCSLQYVVANMQVIVKRQDRAHGAGSPAWSGIMPGLEGDVISVAGMMPLTRRPKADI